jgi:hypothetical protein
LDPIIKILALLLPVEDKLHALLYDLALAHASDERWSYSTYSLTFLVKRRSIATEIMLAVDFSLSENFTIDLKIPKEISTLSKAYAMQAE